MNTSKSYTILLMIVSVIIITACIFYYSNIEAYPAKINNQIDQENLVVNNELKPLSEEAEYPSPVQQLQQTVVHGLINADAPGLPLLEGDLAEFSQNNIIQKYPMPEELQQLKMQLKQLQAMTTDKR